MKTTQLKYFLRLCNLNKRRIFKLNIIIFFPVLFSIQCSLIRGVSQVYICSKAEISAGVTLFLFLLHVSVMHTFTFNVFEC